MRSHRRLREARKRVLDAAIRAAQQRAERVSPRVRAAFDHLLWAVQEHTTVLSPHAVATDRSRAFVGALLAIATRRWDWRRPLAAWVPSATSSGELVLVALAEHLFALFPVPRFMTAAWLGTRQQQDWYIRLGAGESVRAIDFPVRLNRRMAHMLRSAPDDLPILAALRWAQVRGTGGTPELARAVATTRLGRETGDEDFLLHAIGFIVERGDLEPALVDALVEFFHDRRRAETLSSLDRVWPVGTDPRTDVALCALGPRTCDRILYEWGYRSAVPKRPRARGLTWKAAPFAGLYWCRFESTAARVWRVVELTTSEDLRQEGIAMRHCVATYAPKCAFGGSSIWSMTFEEAGLKHRAVTIEVDRKRRTVCQVKGPANRRPRKRVFEVLQRWVKEQGLTLERWIAPAPDSVRGSA